jgi:putative Mg2+ transporter-C (MgtC) family protein
MMAFVTIDQINHLFTPSGAQWLFDILLRMFLATAAGAVVGIEREYHGRPAGMRTHILVSLGSAMISLISLEMGLMVPMSENIRIQVDPGRIVQGVVTGIGFLGAGAIIKIGLTARGLTTAASLWCIAIVGMGFGFGIYSIPILGTFLMLFTLMILGRIEKEVEKDFYKTVSAKVKGPVEQIDNLRSVFKKYRWAISDMKVEYENDESMNVTVLLRLNRKHPISELIHFLKETDYIEQFRVS